MLRVFVVRIASQKVENASILLRPILSSIHNHVADLSFPSELDAYKVKILHFPFFVLSIHLIANLFLFLLSGLQVS